MSEQEATQPQDEAQVENISTNTASSEESTAEIIKYKEQALRLAAELENLRKRSAKEIEEAHKFAVTKFARDLIEVLENLHRAESSISSEALDQDSSLKQIFTGVELTKKSLTDAFDKHGIKRIEPSLGSEFNHDIHQAIAHIPSETHPDGTIAQVIQAGYLLNDRLLRPALVAVAKQA